MQQQWMTTTEVAAALGVTRQTVGRWVRDGRIKALRIRVGDKATYRIAQADFLDFVRKYARDDWR